MNDPYRVLFVCTGNICRSPMAEAILRESLPERLKSKVTVASAGTHAKPGNRAEPLAVLAAQELGVTINDHQATPAVPELLAQSEMVLVMEKMHAIEIKSLLTGKEVRVRLLGEFNPSGQVIEIPDPYGRDLSSYRKSAKLIKQCVASVAGFLDMMLD